MAAPASVASPTEATASADSVQEVSSDAEGAQCPPAPCTDDEASSSTQERKRTVEDAEFTSTEQDAHDMPPPTKRPRKLDVNHDADDAATAADAGADTEAADKLRVFEALEILRQHPGLTAEVASETGSHVADFFATAAATATALGSNPFDAYIGYGPTFSKIFSVHVMPYVDARSACAMRSVSRKFRTIVEGYSRPCFRQIMHCLASQALCARAPDLVERYLRDCNPWVSEVFGVAMSAVIASALPDVGAKVLHTIARHSLRVMAMGDDDTDREIERYIPHDDDDIENVSEGNVHNLAEHVQDVLGRVSFRGMDTFSAMLAVHQRRECRDAVASGSSDDGTPHDVTTETAEDPTAVAEVSVPGLVNPSVLMARLIRFARAELRWQCIAGTTYGGRVLEIEYGGCDFCQCARERPWHFFRAFFMGAGGGAAGMQSERRIRQPVIGVHPTCDVVMSIQRTEFGSGDLTAWCSDALGCSRMSPDLLHAAMLYGVYPTDVTTAPHVTDDAMYSICTMVCNLQSLAVDVDIAYDMSAVMCLLGMPGVAEAAAPFLSAPLTGDMVATRPVLAPLIPDFVDAGLRIVGRTANGKSLVMKAVNAANANGLRRLAPLALAEGLTRGLQIQAVRNTVTSRDWSSLRILVNSGFCVAATCLADLVESKTQWFLNPHARLRCMTALIGNVYALVTEPARIAAVVNALHEQHSHGATQAASEFICTVWRKAKKEHAMHVTIQLAAHPSFCDAVELGIVQQMALLESIARGMTREQHQSIGIDYPPCRDLGNIERHSGSYKLVISSLHKLEELRSYALIVRPVASVDVLRARALHSFVPEVSRLNWPLMVRIAEGANVMKHCLTAAVVHTDDLICAMFGRGLLDNSEAAIGARGASLIRAGIPTSMIRSVLIMAEGGSMSSENAYPRMARRLLRWCAMLRCAIIPFVHVTTAHMWRLRQMTTELVAKAGLSENDTDDGSGTVPFDKTTWRDALSTMIRDLTVLAVQASDDPGLGPIERLFCEYSGDLSTMLQQDSGVRTGLQPGTAPTGDAHEVLSYCVSSVCINVGDTVPKAVMDVVVSNTLGVNVACISPEGDTSGRTGYGLRGEVDMLRERTSGFWYWNKGRDDEVVTDTSA